MMLTFLSLVDRGARRLALAELRTVVTRPLGDKVMRPCFTKEPVRPELTIEANWIDTAWPKVVDVAWDDAAAGCPSEAVYYVRGEQIDGNIAWSSPIWFVDESPFGE